MKSLHVIPSISLLRGGPTYAVLETVKALKSLGVDSQIVTTNDNGAGELIDVPLNQKIEYKGLPVRFFNPFYLPTKKVTFNSDKAFLFSPGLTKWLWQHIHKYDILETRYLFSYPSDCARIIAQLQDIPYIVHPTGQLTPWALSQSQRKKQLYNFLLERRNLNKASAIQCSSQGEAQDVRNFGVKTPIYTVPVGVNQASKCLEAKQNLRAIHKIEAGTPIVIFLSRLHPKKRPNLLIETLGQLFQQKYNFYLILAGSGEPDYVSHLKNLVTSFGLDNRTSFTGFVTGNEKDLLLQGADIFVLPSFSENFGIAVVEAMAVGLPVIVTPDIQIASEISAAKAGLVVEGEVDKLFDALAQLLNSPSLRSTLGNNGKDLAKARYAWQAIAKDIVTIYESIIQRKSLPPKLLFS